MNLRTDSSEKPRSRKRWIVTWTVLLAAFVAAFLFPRRAGIRVQTDPNLALHWILVPEGNKSSTLLLGRDRDHDSLPELYFQVGEPVGTQWRTLLRRAELRPDFFQALVLELAGSDGRERQRWLVDSEDPNGFVNGRDTSMHFHARALNGEDVCFTQERCAGVFAFKSPVEFKFHLNGKRATLVESFQYIETGIGSESIYTVQVVQDGELIRELKCGSRSRFILRSEYLDRGFCYRMELAEDFASSTCARINLLTGIETTLEVPSLNGQIFDHFQALSTPIQLPNGNLVGQLEVDTEKGISLVHVPLEPQGPPAEVARFLSQENGNARDLESQYLRVNGNYLRLNCYFDDTNPDALQIACTFMGSPEQVEVIDSIPKMGASSAPFSVVWHEARVVPDQNGDQVDDIVVALMLTKSSRTAIGYLKLSGATGKILPR